MRLKKILLLLISLPFALLAQQSKTNTIEISGTVIDSSSNIPMDYVTISLFDSKTQNLVTGNITNPKGAFNLPNITNGMYYITVSFVGYTTKTIQPIEVTSSSKNLNLNTIYLNSSLDLKEVVVIGNVPTVTYEIDKKVINVEDLNTTIGQSAVEVLQNTPSIKVDNEGNVSLRGSNGFTLLINGRPTAMDASDALQSIPASTIKNIEIVTNPSARQDAEGSGGIINIITKQNKLKGISVLANITGGNFNQYGGDVSLSYTTNKSTLNLNASIDNNNNIRSTFEERITNLDSTQLAIVSNGVASWQRGGYKLGFEWLYELKKNQTLSVGSNLGWRDMTPFDNADFKSYKNGELVNSYYNEQYSDILIKSISSFANYKYTFDEEKSSFSLSAVHNLRTVDEYVYSNIYNENNTKTGGNFATEFGPSSVIRLNADFIKAFSDKIAFETGSQVQLGVSKDDRDSYSYDPNTETNVIIPLQSTDVRYNRNIYAIYTLARGKSKKFGYQVGLRTEYTDRKIEATSLNYPFQKINRLDWFPSAHMSYQINEDQQVLISYSRRIERPRAYYFEPFITYQNTYSLRRGNPNLNPEYVNVGEINWIKKLSNKGTFSIETYGKYLTGLISNIPTVYDTNIIIRSPFNVGKSTAIGMEPNIAYYVYNWWNSNFSANLFYYKVKSDVPDVLGTNESINWNLNFTNTFTYKKDWRIQFVCQYDSRSATAIGTQEENLRFNGSLRKAFLKNRLAVTFQVRDIFSTQRDISTSNLNNVRVFSYDDPYSPKFSLTLSLKLNNYKKVMDKQSELDDF